MTNIKDINASKLIREASSELKSVETVKIPSWARFIKTGPAKMRQPDNNDWWYMRAASILRKVAVDGPIGVSKLKTKYGSKKNRGHRPEEFRKGAGKNMRVI